MHLSGFFSVLWQILFKRVLGQFNNLKDNTKYIYLNNTWINDIHEIYYIVHYTKQMMLHLGLVEPLAADGQTEGLEDAPL